MNTWIVFFLLGCFSALCWSTLPSAALLCIAAFVCLISVKYNRLALSGMLTGVIWLALVGYWQLSWQLPSSLVKQSVWVEGQITTVVLPANPIRFNLLVTRFNHQPLDFNAPTLRLSWNEPSFLLQQGQKVKLRVKLKPAHGLANDARFNYQQWLLANHIRATGYVINKADNQILQPSVSWRQGLLNEFVQLPLQNTRWLAALTLGYRGLLEPDDWQLAQRTGIAHLIAISGLHLGIVSALSYWLFSQLLGRFCPQQINVHHASILIALCSAFGYSFLSGFSLPTLRAWLMLLMVSILVVRYQYWRPSRIWLSCLLIFMLLMPLSMLSVSFWLSFMAVMIIGLLFWRWPVVKQSKTAQRAITFKQSLTVMVRVQMVLCLMMLPMVAWQFGLMSFVAPFVNLLAVPVVTLILVPLCLLGLLAFSVSSNVAMWIFSIADWLASYCITALEWVSQLHGVAISLMDIGVMAWLCLSVFIVQMCLPPLPIKKVLSSLLLLPLLSHFIDTNKPDWRVDVLDVGQGLSVIVQAQQHAFVYDVGPAYPSGFNMADAVLLPVLQKRGIQSLDWVFISHHDMDHIGSLASLSAQIPIRQKLSNHDQCQQGWQQQWHGLRLKVLWPPADFRGNENNRSCVLMISDGLHKVLLAGDIEQLAEQHLVTKSSNDSLQADILIVPHHGSKTSSSPAFIDAVNPQLVVFSQGYLNRWHFPDKQVVARYQQRSARIYSTSENGQTSFIFSPENIATLTYRQDVYPYWYANN